jgi:putative DNA methylase
MDYDKSFIEVQFPVSKVSKESYKERKANLGQTLTGLGKWWGRKPLILVRAAVLGLLMPASDNPKKDREIFLKILTMDENGLWLRKDKSIPQKTLYEYLTPHEKEKYFIEDSGGKIKYRAGISKKDKENLQRLVFNRLSYDEKLKYCKRPEEVKLVDKKEWDIINEHLNTNAYSLEELIQQLGERKFGRTPVIGDCFSGGGSIPFEAARMGCDVYASDLNPIAMLLTWAGLNIAGASDEEIELLRQFQQKVYDEVNKQVQEWGIETNEAGDRADAYLYCHEVICPECHYRVPLSPSWVIGKGTKTIALLKDNGQKGFDIEIMSNVTNEEMKYAESFATIKNNSLYCPHCKNYTPITVIRGDRRNDDGNIQYGLRKWEKNEFIPQENDVFQERLYCIRYVHEYFDENGNLKTERYYVAPSKEDLDREKKVVELLKERFTEWQNRGFIPSSMIEEGYNTTQPIRERGWTYWHQLFHPRQLLIHGLFMEKVNEIAITQHEKVVGLLGINKCCNWNSKLSQWLSDASNEKGAQTFSNQALNTLYNYLCRTTKSLDTTWFYNINNYEIHCNQKVKVKDARAISDDCDIWITDPPYADAVNYHELSEFFLAWDKNMLTTIFPDWYTDSKRILAVRGAGESFNTSMVEIYSNLANHMPDNGMQIVMFTHQDPRVWAELSMILWSAGLQVTSAWNIATETDANGLRQGNYVKGTVLLTLRKQISDETAYLDELYPDIEAEVKAQIDSMRELDDKEDPNFSDPDYLLAAYAASLKVLTSYKKIEDIDVKYELAKLRTSNEESPIEKIIQDAVKIAYDYLIPTGFDHYIWKMLTPEERFYIKGLELEKQNVYQLSGYQELARGFGVREYRDLLGNTRANNARLKTASEFAMRGLNDNSKFGSSLLRNVLVAIYLSVKEEDTMKGRNWLKTELVDYWNVRTTIVEILSYISSLQYIENMEHWKEDAYAASMLKELISNDGI